MGCLVGDEKTSGILTVPLSGVPIGEWKGDDWSLNNGAAMARFELVLAMAAPPKGEAVRDSGSGASFHASAGIQVCGWFAAVMGALADGDATRGAGLKADAFALSAAAPV
jgi:hypothetical protein